MQWRNFLFYTLEYFIENKLNNFELTWSKWCKNANTILINLHKQPFVADELKPIVEEVFSLSIKAPSGLAKINVSEFTAIENVNTEELQIRYDS